MEPSAKKNKAPWGGVGLILSILSLVTLSLISLGYGVALAGESVFGMPHGALFASTFDLVDL